MFALRLPACTGADVLVPTRTISMCCSFSVETLPNQLHLLRPAKMKSSMWNSTNTWNCGPCDVSLTSFQVLHCCKPISSIPSYTDSTHSLGAFTKPQPALRRRAGFPRVIPNPSATSFTGASYLSACCSRTGKKAPKTSAFLSATCKSCALPDVSV